MQIPDLIIGLAFVVGGIALGMASFGMPGLGGQMVGPGLLPTIVAAGFVLFGGGLALQGLKSARVALPPLTVLSWQALRVPTVVIGGLLLYIAVLEPIGFLVATTAYVAAVILVSGGRLVSGLIFAAAITLGIDWVFLNLMGVPLPAGIIG